MKSILLPLILLFCGALVLSPATKADDILSASTPKKSAVNAYPTGASFLTATKSGEIPNLLQDGNSMSNATKLGGPVFNILQKEYALSKAQLYGGAPQTTIGILIGNLTKYELGGHEQSVVDAYHRNQDGIFGKAGDTGNKHFAQSRDAFDRFAREYVKALQAYAASKQQVDLQQRTAAATERRERNAMNRQVAEQQEQSRALVTAQIASQDAAEQIKAEASKQAVDEQKSVREEKLKETLTSPAYKLWVASLQVQRGQEMIAQAQSALDHETAVQNASGVINLAAKRSAGEQMVAGKALSDKSFATYKQLGGKAATPGEVTPGPDPAAPYR